MIVYVFHILMDSVNYHWAWRFCLYGCGWDWSCDFPFLFYMGFWYQDSAISWNESVSTIPSLSSLWDEYDFLLQCLAAFSGTDIRDLELLVLACCVCGDSGLVAESCPTLAIPRTKEPGRQATVHEILQARILAWVPISFLRGPSRPRSWTPVSCFVGWFLTNWATREAHVCACVGSLIYRLGFNGFMINQVLNFIFWIFYKM